MVPAPTPKLPQRHACERRQDCLFTNTKSVSTMLYTCKTVKSALSDVMSRYFLREKHLSTSAAHRRHGAVDVSAWGASTTNMRTFAQVKVCQVLCF